MPRLLVLTRSIKQKKQKKKHLVLADVCSSNSLAGQIHLKYSPRKIKSNTNMEFDGSILIHNTKNTEPGKVEDVADYPMTLHCQHCNTVLSDSVSICGETKYLDSIICLSKLT